MINSFLISFKLKNTYRVNSIIYALKHTPIIKKLFSSSLYKSKSLVIIANIISFIIEFIYIFIGKILYILALYGISTLFTNQSLAFTNMIVFLTLIGGFLNTNIYNPSVDNYYALELLKFDPKKYILSNYIYFLIKQFIGLTPFIILLGLNINLSIVTCLLIPLYVISIKNIFNYFMLSSYKNNEKTHNENKFTLHGIIWACILLILSFLPPYFNIGITESILIIISIISIIFGTLSFISLYKSNNYKLMYRELLLKDETISAKTINNDKIYKNIITNDIKIKSNKKGYAYLNDIFVQRHKKLLFKATKNISIAIIIFIILSSIACILFPSIDSKVNDLLKNSLSYFLFLMYFINRGQKICQTMFMNCDHSMLTYRFYRQSNAILSLFKERLITMIKLNLIPGFLMSLGVVMLLYFTGGATYVEYIISFITIIAMSIFFSIHYLVLYYLLQPYDVNLQIKNPTFMAVCGFTYFICYMGSQTQIPTIIFGICMCSFTVIYSLLGLFLSYKYAPKTFKLRI